MNVGPAKMALSQNQYAGLFDRLGLVGLGGDPLLRDRTIRKLARDYADPTCAAMSDDEFRAAADPLMAEAGRDQNDADRRTDY